MSRLPLVSILIPCYNNEKWIGRAIDSALAQSLSDTEVLVYDDGSTDKSQSIIRQFEHRVSYEFGDRVGGNAARNQLLKRAAGQWVQFLDGDDELRVEKVENDVGIGEKMGADCVYGPVIIRWMSSDTSWADDISRPKADRSTLNHWFDWQFAQTGALLWRTQAIRSIGGWNEEQPCCQDNELCMRAIQAGLKIVESTNPGAVYRIWGDDSVSRKDPSKVLREKAKLLRQMFDWAVENDRCSPQLEQRVANIHFQMARAFATRDLSEAVRFANTSIAKGLFEPADDELPFFYSMAYRMGGFSFAERVAKWTRLIRR